jgi:hypothetical protein
MNGYDRAAEIYRSGFQRTGDSSLKSRLKSLEFVSDEALIETPEEKREEDWIPADHQVVRFMDLFTGREAVYARQWVSSTGESGYTPVFYNYAKILENLCPKYTVAGGKGVGGIGPCEPSDFR